MRRRSKPKDGQGADTGSRKLASPGRVDAHRNVWFFRRREADEQILVKERNVKKIYTYMHDPQCVLSRTVL